MDPVFAIALRAALGLLFLVAAWHKLSDRGAFAAAIADYRLLPEGVTSVAGVALVVLEIVAAISLLAPVPAWPGVALAGALLVAYTTAIGVNLARGRRDLDCGCMGPVRRQPIGVGLVVRNAVLLAGALLCLVPARDRRLGWLDGFTVIAAVAVAAGLYAAVEQIMAAGPGLARLRTEA